MISTDTMRAAVLTKTGSEWSLDVERLRIPRPAPGEILIRVRACGVCRSDLHVAKGESPFPLPAVVGHEISGTVAECGTDYRSFTSYDLAVGTHVIVPFIMPCGACAECRRGNEEICEKFLTLNRRQGFLYDGTGRLFRADTNEFVAQYSQGGMAEYSCVPATAVFPLPSSVPLDEASIIGCSVFTAFGAVKHAANVRPGDSVAVIGSGGVGQQCIQFAAAFGASRIIAIDVKDAQLDAVKLLGATDTINAADTDVVAAIHAMTGGRGVDICIEALGTPATLSQAFQCVAGCGRCVAIGLAAPTIVAPIEMNRLIRRRITLVGSYGAKARTDCPQILDLIERGSVKLTQSIGQRFSLEQASEALRLMNEGRLFGRAVIDMQL